MPDFATAQPWASAVRAALPPFAVDLALASMLLLAAAAAAAAAMRRASAAARHLVWCAAVSSLILLPALWAVMPRWDAMPTWGNVSPDVGRARLPALPAQGAAGANVAALGAPDSGGHPSGAAGPHAGVRRASLYVAVFWGLGVLWLLVPPLAGRAAMRQLERGCARLGGESWGETLRRACGELRIRRRVVLLAGDGVVVPMTWGTLRPRVLLPAGCASWSDERRRVVLLHELGHVARFDCLTDFVAQLVRAAYWFNPLAWLAVERMRVERERACDDVVLRLGTRASSYADHLVAIVSALKHRPVPWAAAAMARSSQVGRRVREILEDRRHRQPVTARHVAAAATLMLLVTVPLACMKGGSAGRGPARSGESGGAAIPATPDVNVTGVPAGWTAEQLAAADDLRQLAAAMRVYAAEWRGRYPEHLILLLSYGGYVDRKLSPADQARLFLSPQDELRVTVPERPTRGWLLGTLSNTKAGYVYLGKGATALMRQPFQPTILLMHTDLATPFREVEGRETAVGVFFDGHAEILPLAEVRRLSEETRKAIEEHQVELAEWERTRRKKDAGTQPAEP